MPLRARLEPWMVQLCAGKQLHAWVQQHGSPLNVLQTDPLKRNLQELNTAAANAELDFRVFFARKANKCLGLVDAVHQLQAGFDTASGPELQQVLDRGVEGRRIICTAAIKDAELLRMCLASGVTVAIDNVDELAAIDALARQSHAPASLALRVSGFAYHGRKLDSRFGIDVDCLLDVVRQHWEGSTSDRLRLDGIHFHLDGCSAAQRVAAIDQSLDLIDCLSQLGHQLRFLDIGGGIPVSYLQSEDEWDQFWRAHRQALLGYRPPLTYRNHGLGRFAVNGEVHGQPNSYPCFQSPIRGEWLANLLTASSPEKTIAEGIRARNLQLRCEPGRSLLDGCGMTVARVEYRKRDSRGDWLIGLSMNRTQCRTTDDDFLVDPLLIRRDEGEPGSHDPADRAIQGYLVGAYCTECELLLQRKLRFPRGVRAGDLIVFPNTAGYLMHFRESRSHQFPLAKNVYAPRESGFPPVLDDIDRAG